MSSGIISALNEVTGLSGGEPLGSRDAASRRRTCSEPAGYSALRPYAQRSSLSRRLLEVGYRHARSPATVLDPSIDRVGRPPDLRWPEGEVPPRRPGPASASERAGRDRLTRLARVRRRRCGLRAPTGLPSHLRDMVGYELLGLL